MPRRWSTPLACCAVMLFAVSALAAEPPQTLAWKDLVNRPERWPDEVRVARDMPFKDRTVKQGTVVKITQLKGRNAVLALPDGFAFNSNPDDSDLLEAANKQWATLTPAQRQLTVDAILRDRSLWPAEVTVQSELDYRKFKIAAGQTVPLVRFNPNGDVAMLVDGQAGLQSAPMSSTDAFARARKLAGMSPEQRPGRMNALLGDRLVDADAKPAKVEPAEWFVWYVSASTCPRCAAFNPAFREVYDQDLAQRKDVLVYGSSTDQTMEPFYAYVKQNQMPWRFLPHDRKEVNSALGNLGVIEIPGLVVFDKHGNVKVSTATMRGQPLRNAEDALRQLKAMMAAKN